MIRNECGFTITELLVALAVVALVLAGALGTLEVGLATVRTSAGRAETQGNARVAMERMVPDIRSAGYDPTGAMFDVVTNQSATSVTLQSDRNASGVIDAPAAGACDPTGPSEIVRYRLVGAELRRSVNPAIDGCETVVVGGVQVLAFTYLDATGAATAVSANIRTVTVSLTLRPETAGHNSHQPTAATMADRVRLRNR